MAITFRYLEERKLNKNQSSSVAPLFLNAQSKRVNALTGSTDLGYNCIIYTKFPEVLKANGVVIETTYDKFVTAWLSLEQIVELSKLPEVDFIDTPKILKANNDISVATSGASLLQAGRLDNIAYKGDGVIVAIVDSGIDWDHPDFRNPSDQTKSRILRIWDQTLIPITGESAPSGFSFGVEYTQTQINDEIDGSPTGFVREKDYDGHGTHVAGTAVGNGSAISDKYSGLAPNADIVIIKSGNGTFNTTNVIAALNYLKNLATSLGKPIVVNLSIGSQTSAHDGTDPLEIAIDNFTDTAAGRIVVVASGNENGENIHKQSTIASNSSTSINLQVPSVTGSTSQDVFQFTMYANDSSAIGSLVTAPDGSQASSLSTNGTSVFGGKARVFITNIIDPESGDRKIQVYVTRATNTTNVTGSWSISLTNATSNTLTIDSWLDTKGADFSNITLTGGDSNYLIGTPGSATKAITVGAYMGKIDWYGASLNPSGSIVYSGYNYTNGTQDNICTFSSIGPRRDNVQKPDITANGQAVVSCLSSDSGLADSDPYMVVNGLYRVEQGSSMATPTVSGCVALLLQKKSDASFAQIKTAISSTATKDSFTGTADNATWGSGKIDVFRAASSFSYCQPLSRTTYNYEQAYGSTANPSSIINSNRAAIRFSPTSSGLLGGVYFRTGTTANLNSFTIELRANNAGMPGTIIGSLAITSSKIAKNSWNYFDLSSLSSTITNGTDYFIVLVPGSGDTFSLGRENSNNGRSYSSSNGTSWTVTNNWRIRPMVYGTPVSGSATIALSSDVGTDVQNQCVGAAITPIKYTTTGVTGAIFSGLPTGINGTWASNEATISGTSTQAGTYNYSVKIISGCDTVTSTGTIVIGGSPSISSVEVAQGIAGTNVTINGTNFGPNQLPKVTIGGVIASISSATNTKIITTLPVASTGGTIEVTNSCNLMSSPFAYPYVAPTNITLSSTATNENNSIGATVATISATDTDLGDTFTYSLVSGTGSADNASFTIVNNVLKAAIVFQSQIKSSYTIRIRVTDAGGLGFEKSFVITVVPDMDSDGVVDGIDLCPNTTPGVKVDFNGCEIVGLPSNNFAVMTTAASCAGQQSGAISVSATNTNYTYTVTINGQTGFELNSTNSFKNQFQNLATGNYEICISIQGKSNYLQCYNVKVTEPIPLSATNKISNNGKQVTYILNGASSYAVTLNGVTKTYSSSEIILDLVSGQNTINIQTDLNCQGKIFDTIFMNDTIIFYPNPVKDKATLFCAGTDDILDINILDLSGKVTASFSKLITGNRTVELNLGAYATGLYFVQLNGKTVNQTIKVVKQ